MSATPQVEAIVDRLETLRRKLGEDGLYVSENTAALAIGELRRICDGRGGDGGPAFPMESPNEIFAGMSLRDWFAGQALPKTGEAFPNEFERERLADNCYAMAASMLRARERLVSAPGLRALGTKIAGEFIQSIESLAEDAEATASMADAEARADDVHPNDARAAEAEADELAYIARELRTLAGMLYGRVMLKKGAA